MHRLFELRRIDRTIGAANFPAAKAYGGNLDVRSAKLPVFHGRFLIVLTGGTGTISHGRWALVEWFCPCRRLYPPTCQARAPQGRGRWINDTQKSQSKHVLRPDPWRQYRCASSGGLMARTVTAATPLPSRGPGRPPRALGAQLADQISMRRNTSSSVRVSRRPPSRRLQRVSGRPSAPFMSVSPTRPNCSVPW